MDTTAAGDAGVTVVDASWTNEAADTSPALPPHGPVLFQATAGAGDDQRGTAEGSLPANAGEAETAEPGVIGSSSDTVWYESWKWLAYLPEPGPQAPTGGLLTVSAPAAADAAGDAATGWAPDGFATSDPPVSPGDGGMAATGSTAPASPSSDDTKSGSGVARAESDASATVVTTVASEKESDHSASSLPEFVNDLLNPESFTDVLRNAVRAGSIYSAFKDGTRKGMLDGAAGAWNGIWNLPEYLSQANQARIAFGNYLGIALVNPDEAMRTPIGQAIDSLGYNGHQGAMIAGRIANELISGNISPETKNLVEKVREATRTVIDSVADEISKLPAEQAAAVLGEVAGAIQWEMAVGAAVAAASAGVLVAARAGRLAQLVQRITNITGNPEVGRRIANTIEQVIAALDNLPIGRRLDRTPDDLSPGPRTPPATPDSDLPPRQPRTDASPTATVDDSTPSSGKGVPTDETPGRGAGDEPIAPGGEPGTGPDADAPSSDPRDPRDPRADANGEPHAPGGNPEVTGPDNGSGDDAAAAAEDGLDLAPSSTEDGTGNTGSSSNAAEDGARDADDAAGAVALNSGLGKLVKVDSPDPAADALARRLGGESRVRFENGPQNEFDTVSDLYVAQSKPANLVLNKQFRDQAKVTFETALKTGRRPYFHFEGPPHRDVLRKIEEYAKRYGIEPVIDITPLN